MVLLESEIFLFHSFVQTAKLLDYPSTTAGSSCCRESFAACFYVRLFFADMLPIESNVSEKGKNVEDFKQVLIHFSTFIIFIFYFYFFVIFERSTCLPLHPEQL